MNKRIIGYLFEASNKLFRKKSDEIASKRDDIINECKRRAEQREIEALKKSINKGN